MKPTPGLQAAPGVQNRAMTMPMTMENTGPPMTGTSLPSSHEGMAMARHTAMPGRYFLMVCIRFLIYFRSLRMASTMRVSPVSMMLRGMARFSRT